MNYTSGAISIFFAILFISCGEGKVTVTNESYEPRIVIEGFLFPNQNVEKIRITRNFKLDENISNRDILVIEDAIVNLIDENGTPFRLFFHSSSNFDDNYYEYRGNELVIEYGMTYTLDVTATVEGKELHTRATTTVPEIGFKIAEVNFDSLEYRQREVNGDLLKFILTIDRSPGTTFYVSSIRPLTASSSNFIFDNPFTDETPEDVDDNLDDFNYWVEWIQDTPSTQGKSFIDIFWFFLWFYGEYEIIVYAADLNYKNYLQTYEEVQEPDGNFHEPRFEIEGDGIGVFGSVISDTVYISVLQK